MKRVALLCSLIICIMLTTNVYAEDNIQKVGLGYHGIISGDFVQGLSLRYWPKNNFGLEGNFYYAGIKVEVDGFDWDASIFALTGKLLFAPVIKNNSKFYIGFEGGYGRASADEVDDDLDILVIAPLIGAEYSFSEIPELWFDWEVGYRYNIFSIDIVDISLHDISAAIGVHYYF